MATLLAVACDKVAADRDALQSWTQTRLAQLKIEEARQVRQGVPELARAEKFRVFQAELEAREAPLLRRDAQCKKSGKHADN